MPVSYLVLGVDSQRQSFDRRKKYSVQFSVLLALNLDAPVGPLVGQVKHEQQRSDRSHELDPYCPSVVDQERRNGSGRAVVDQQVDKMPPPDGRCLQVLLKRKSERYEPTVE